MNHWKRFLCWHAFSEWNNYGMTFIPMDGHRVFSTYYRKCFRCGKQQSEVRALSA